MASAESSFHMNGQQIIDLKNDREATDTPYCQVTIESVHDTQVAEKLILNTLPLEYFLLADVGYISRQLHACLENDGYELWTPFRHNMAGAKEHNSRQLKAIRRTIETDFSLLKYYNAENNRARSLNGFQE